LRREPFDALHDVSLRIEPGEMVGFLGHNGAGKSTLLKVIAGITEPTRGKVHVSGRVTSLLELGVGFHPDLTGMENIFYNGAIMGMSRRQILDRLDSIIAFSGLADFLFEAVRHYSSGMYSRLACSVALHLEPEIVLMDEILSVGDAEFQQRALARVKELHRQGVTILLVSHDATAMATLSDRVVWIDHGRVREQGSPVQVMAHYSKAMMELAEEGGPFRRQELAPGDRMIRDVRMERGGQRTTQLQTGESLDICMELGPVDRPHRIGLRLRRASGEVLVEEFSPVFAPCATIETTRYHIDWLPLLASEGTVSVVLVDADTGRPIDQRIDAVEYSVATETATHQFVVRPLVSWSVTRAETASPSNL
jgi:ABC-type polysaccharide/polyol phosphate transport system ATPase subunit